MIRSVSLPPSNCHCILPDMPPPNSASFCGGGRIFPLFCFDNLISPFSTAPMCVGMDPSVASWDACRHIFNKEWISIPQQLPTASRSLVGAGTGAHLSHLCQNFDWLLQVTIAAMRSWMWWPWCVQQTASRSPPPHLSLLTFFPPHLL